MTVQRFGKYKSRRKKAGAIQAAPTEAAPKKAAPKEAAPVKAKKVNKVEKAVSMVKTVAKAAKPAIDYFGMMAFGDKKGGSLHPDIMKLSRGMSHYAHQHVKAAAAHILGKAHSGPHIGHHMKQMNAHAHHYHQILNSTEHGLRAKIHQDPGFKQAVSDVMHSAEKGGAISFKHETGGGLGSAAVHVAKNIANPIKEAQAAKSQYDQIDLHDTSAGGMAHNALHAYSGNFHVGSAAMKASAIAAPAFAGAFLPASEGFAGVSRGLDAVGGFF